MVESTESIFKGRIPPKGITDLEIGTLRGQEVCGQTRHELVNTTLQLECGINGRFRAATSSATYDFLWHLEYVGTTEQGLVTRT